MMKYSALKKQSRVITDREKSGSGFTKDIKPQRYCIQKQLLEDVL